MGFPCTAGSDASVTCSERVERVALTCGMGRHLTARGSLLASVSVGLTLTALAGEVAAEPEALAAAGWNRSRAARRLGIDRTTLWRKIKEYGLEPEDR